MFTSAPIPKRADVVARSALFLSVDDGARVVLLYTGEADALRVDDALTIDLTAKKVRGASRTVVSYDNAPLAVLTDDAVLLLAQTCANFVGVAEADLPDLASP